MERKRERGGRSAERPGRLQGLYALRGDAACVLAEARAALPPRPRSHSSPNSSSIGAQAGSPAREPPSRQTEVHSARATPLSVDTKDRTRPGPD